MTITDQQLKGNWAEQFIASQLSSQSCFIRQVTQGHDTGIDLYCETTQDGKPFLHFWCQVKTSNRWKGIKKKISFKPKKRHLEYWLSQPVPVYVFLVPDMRGNKNIPYYICSPIENVNEEKLHSFSKISNANDLSLFITKTLTVHTVLWELKEGKVSYLQTTRGKYIKQFIPNVSHRFEPKILRSIEWTLWRLGEDILFHNIDPVSMLDKSSLAHNEKVQLRNATPYIQALKSVIIGKPCAHYENYKLVGKYHELRNEYSKAKEFYKKSVSIINNDPNVNNNLRPWNEILQFLNSRIKNCEDKSSS